MKRVLSYLRKFKKEMIVGPSFKIMETFFELLTPFIMAKLIDQGIPSDNMQLIFKYGGLLFLFAILGYSFTMLCQYMAARAQEGFGTILRKDLFEHIQALSLTQTSQFGASSLVTRLTTDIYQLQTALAMFIRMAPRAPFILLGSTVMAFIINAKLAIIFIVVIPLITLVLVYVMRKTIPFYQKVQTKIDGLGMLTNENLTGARVIRAFSKQDNQYETFKESTESLKDLSLEVGKFESLLNPATFFIVNAAIFFIIYFGKFEINIGSITQGEIIALINYATQISIALVVLVNLSITFSKGYSSLQRVGAVFDIEPEAQPTEVPAQVLDVTPPAVMFDRVSFTYPDASEPMLEDMSFAVRKGGTLGIIGGTGSGKSTLIRLIAKLYKPTSGAIYIDGMDITECPDELLHKKVEIVFQKAVLFRGTIEENLRMGNKDATTDDIWKALEVAQATDFVKAKPEGLDYVIEEGGKNLSGGQRQRLTIARGVVANPEIIVFDDTSSALDYVTDSRLRQAIAKLNMTVIVVSQRVHAIEQSDQIIVLNEGKVEGLGTHEELLKESKIYQEITASQQQLKEDK